MVFTFSLKASGCYWFGGGLCYFGISTFIDVSSNAFRKHLKWIILINAYKSIDRKVTYIRRACSWLYDLNFCLHSVPSMVSCTSIVTLLETDLHPWHAFRYEKERKMNAPCHRKGIGTSVSLYVGFSKTQSKRGRCHACGWAWSHLTLIKNPDLSLTVRSLLSFLRKLSEPQFPYL